MKSRLCVQEAQKAQTELRQCQQALKLSQVDCAKLQKTAEAQEQVSAGPAVNCRNCVVVAAAAVIFTTVLCLLEFRLSLWCPVIADAGKHNEASISTPSQCGIVGSRAKHFERDGVNFAPGGYAGTINGS
jgi:hypothetical protein